MARILRATQKIFALAATNNGVFGSAAAGTKVLSNDPEDIQSLPAWGTGWLAAVLGTKKFPALEEFQAIQYLTTRQISYLFQEGIAEYDSGSTYYIKSIVKKAGTYELYGSITDNNTGNTLPVAPASNSNWAFLTDLSASYAQATESTAGIAKIATVAQTKAGTDDATIVTPLKLSPFVIPVGGGMDYWGASAPSGWTFSDGQTIGSAASGATNRANADTIDLYTLLWNSIANAQLPIQDSSGAASTRGANAAADFAANKRLPIPDKRGRVSAGKDNMGGTPAGRLSGQPLGVNGLLLGAAGGEESHQLTVPELASHFHVYTYWSGFRSTAGSGSTADVPTVGNTNNTGGDQPHNNVQPAIVCNYIIKL